jgi:alpha/beta hydrolase fold
MTNYRYTILVSALVLAGCAHYSAAPETRSTVAKSLREARSKDRTAEERAALYLHAAAEAAPRLGSGNEPTAFRDTYNAAAAELTVLLRSADNGRLWNRPLTLSANGIAYHLRFHPGTHDVIWPPDYFTAFVPSSEVRLKVIRKRNVQEGVGGALVGIRKKTPREPFTLPAGVTAPVTATLDFRGREATLFLRDPGERPKAPVAGAVRPLAADFTAALAYYPTVNEFWTGLMGAIRVSHYMGSAGLYLEQPYDPDRIPLIFVHGLISTPQMWRRIINEIEADPVLRGRYQCWVFSYPTGNPVVYSALRLREDLEKARQRYGLPRGFVLVGHSMGGLVSRPGIESKGLRRTGSLTDCLRIRSSIGRTCSTPILRLTEWSSSVRRIVAAISRPE